MDNSSDPKNNNFKFPKRQTPNLMQNSRSQSNIKMLNSTNENFYSNEEMQINAINSNIMKEQNIMLNNEN